MPMKEMLIAEELETVTIYYRFQTLPVLIEHLMPFIIAQLGNP